MRKAIINLRHIYTALNRGAEAYGQSEQLPTAPLIWGHHPLLNKSEVKVSLYLLPFWRYKRFNISGCELSSTTSGHRIDSGEVLFESSYPNNLGKSFQIRPTPSQSDDEKLSNSTHNLRYQNAYISRTEADRDSL